MGAYRRRSMTPNLPKLCTSSDYLLNAKRYSRWYARMICFPRSNVFVVCSSVDAMTGLSLRQSLRSSDSSNGDSVPVFATPYYLCSGSSRRRRRSSCFGTHPFGTRRLPRLTYSWEGSMAVALNDQNNFLPVKRHASQLSRTAASLPFPPIVRVAFCFRPIRVNL